MKEHWRPYKELRPDLIDLSAGADHADFQGSQNRKYRSAGSVDVTRAVGFVLERTVALLFR